MAVYVTGIGVISAAGNNAEENYLSLKNKISGIRKSEKHGFMLGEVSLSNEQMASILQMQDNEISRSVYLAAMAAGEAWKGQVVHPKIRTGVISATSLGGMDITEHNIFHPVPDLEFEVDKSVPQDNGTVTQQLSKYLGIHGFMNTISTACSSGANALMHAARLIEHGRMDRAVTGGTDPIAEYNIYGFASLHVLDSNNCRPFDENRNGLNLAEGAAYLVLESEYSLSITKNKPICMLSGWGNAAEAYHQTASSPDGRGAASTMVEAMQKAGIEPQEIGYINAHGTGTANNDLSESMAMKKVFGEQVPVFSSTKGNIGHAMAAAGSIEAVFSILALKNNCIFPNYYFQDPIVETGLIPATEYIDNKNLMHVLSNSFGFGGNCTSLIFSAVS